MEEQGDQSTFLPLFSLHPFERGKSYLKLKDEKIHLERKKKKKKKKSSSAVNQPGRRNREPAAELTETIVLPSL